MRLVAAGTALSFALVACGQHPGVGEGSGPLAGAADTQDDPLQHAPSSGPVIDEDAEMLGDQGSGDVDAGPDPSAPVVQEEPEQGGADSNGVQGETTGADDEPATQSGDSQRGSIAATPRGSDRTGVTEDAITLAVHAPLTGASPIPGDAAALDEAAQLYWRWQIEEQGRQILGRERVEMVFADDRYEPTAARQVCRELEQQGFLLVSAGGSDQIQACGELAGRLSLPYFSPGVTQAGLEGNPWYFANSLTYKQQGELLAGIVRDRFPDARTGAVITNTPNFEDAVEGWEAGVRDQGVDYARTIRHPRGQTGWYTDVANQLGDDGVEVVYMLTSPLDYIRFTQVADDQGHDFQYVGVGPSMGNDGVTAGGCPDVDGGLWLNPTPGMDVVGDLDPEYLEAAEAMGVSVDGLSAALWASSKTFHQLFDAYEEIYGTDLTREDFRAVTREVGRVENGITPPIEWTDPEDPFGGTSMHLIRADCATGLHVTEELFVGAS